MAATDLGQAAILVLSGAAIWLLAQPRPWSRWGCIAGLAAQPLWLHGTWQAQQWGMFTLSLWYTLVFAQGAYRHFIKVTTP